MPMDDKELQSKVISFLRFPLIMCVVFIHSDLRAVCVQLRYLTVYGGLMTVFIDCLCNVAVPLFFFISGYLFFRSGMFSRKIYIGKLKSRFRSLLIPYIIWNALCLFVIWVMQILRPGTMFLIHKSISDFALKDFFLAFWDIHGISGLPIDQHGPVVGQFWFLQCLMVLVLLSPVIWWCIRRAGIFFILLLGVIFGCGYIVIATGVRIDTLFYFSFGAYFGIRRKSFVVAAYRFRWIALAVFLSAAVYGYIINKDSPDFVYVLTYVSLSVIIICATAKGIAKGSFKSNRFLEKSSFFVFAFHRYITAIMTNMAKSGTVPINGTAFALAYFVIGSVLSMVISLAVYYVMMRTVPKITAVLAGGR
jgi:surface polysaccharide O-acyltransferase-like enzyme